jgi:hypothetical protein
VVAVRERPLQRERERKRDREKERKRKNNLQEDIERTAPGEEGKMIHRYAIWDGQP